MMRSQHQVSRQKWGEINSEGAFLFNPVHVSACPLPISPKLKRKFLGCALLAPSLHTYLYSDFDSVISIHIGV